VDPLGYQELSLLSYYYYLLSLMKYPTMLEIAVGIVTFKGWTLLSG
jgi:hypothetical protein